MCPRLKVRYSLIFWFSADFIKCLVIASFEIVCGICLDKWVQLHKYLSHSQPADYLSPDARLKKIMKHMCTRLPLASQIKINAHLAFWRPTKIIEKLSFMGGERQKKKDGIRCWTGNWVMDGLALAPLTFGISFLCLVLINMRDILLFPFFFICDICLGSDVRGLDDIRWKLP